VAIDDVVEDLAEGGVGECLNKESLVVELVADPLLQLAVYFWEGLPNCRALYAESNQRLFEDVKTVEEELAIVEVARVQVKGSNQCLDNIGVHLPGNVVIPLNFTVSVVHPHPRFLVVLRLDLLVRDVDEGWWQLVAFMGKDVLIDVLKNGLTVEVGVADDVGPLDVQLALVVLWMHQEHLDCRQHL
jgi:hypothetical protein